MLSKVKGAVGPERYCSGSLQGSFASQGLSGFRSEGGDFVWPGTDGFGLGSPSRLLQCGTGSRASVIRFDNS